MIKSRLGHITTERVDDNASNKEKEKFEEYFKFYENVLANVSVSIKTLEEVTPNTKAIKTFQKHCPAFFESLIDNFWAQSVIGLNECFHGVYSFKKFFNYTEANWNKIFTGEWIETTNWDDGTVEKETIKYKRKIIFERIKEARAHLAANDNTILKIKGFRDKAFAHIDKDSPTCNLELTELREIFDVAEKVFNCLVAMYDYVYRCLEPCNSNDVRNIIRIVQFYDKYRKEIRELEYKKIDKEVDEYFSTREKKK